VEQITAAAAEAARVTAMSHPQKEDIGPREERGPDPG